MDRVDPAAFVRANTTPAPVPLAPEIHMYTAREITPVWQALTDLPYWCAPWPGGQALARWVLDHPDEVRGKSVLDFGAGSGLVGIAAKLAGAARVVAVDVDPFAAAACAANAELAGVAIEIVLADVVGRADLAADVLLAGDVWYEREPSARFDTWLRALAGDHGVRVVTGDPGRSYVPPDLVELARYEVPTTLDLESRPTKTTRVLVYPRGL